jgi:HSP20 family protein
MELVRYMPRNFLVRRNTPFAGLFDDFFVPLARTGESAEGILPSVDIYEKDSKVFIDAELPGVAKENIHIDVKGRLLTVSAENRGDNEVKDENTYRRERRYGKFERTFNLAFDIDPEKVDAKYENGVLTLVIPRPEEQKPRQVAIH